MAMEAGPQDRHVAIVFLVIGLLFGSLSALLTPPFQIPDEPAHFFRAVVLSSGRTGMSIDNGRRGAFLPKWSVDFAANELGDLPGVPWHTTSWSRIRSAAPRSYEPAERVFVAVGEPGKIDRLGYTASSYTPLPYAAAAAVIATGRWIGASPLITFYAARLLNLFLASMVIFIAIRIAPAGRWILALLALTPMSIHLLGSLSADGLTIASSFLLIATTVAALLTPPETRAAQFIPLIAAAILVCLTKPNLLLLAPFAVVPHLETRKRRMSFVVAYACAVGTSLFAAARLSGAIGGSGSVHAARQLHYIANDPIGFVKVLGETYLRYGSRYYVEMIGKLGWMDVYLPAAVILACYAVLLLAALCSPIAFSVPLRICFAALFFLSSLMILLTIYATWMTGPADVIAGVQGRYFIPIAPLLFFAIAGVVRCPVDRRTRDVVFTATAVTVLLLSVHSIVSRFYGS